MSGEESVIITAFIVVLGVIVLTQLFIRYKKREKIMEKEPKFEIFNDKKKKFCFRLIAPNGEIICQSESYESKQACKDTIDVLPGYALKAKIVDLTK
jgi:uncharacterized protein YegP (UPF0339 family)